MCMTLYLMRYFHLLTNFIQLSTLPFTTTSPKVYVKLSNESRQDFMSTDVKIREQSHKGAVIAVSV